MCDMQFQKFQKLKCTKLFLTCCSWLSFLKISKESTDKKNEDSSNNFDLPDETSMNNIDLGGILNLATEDTLNIR